MRKTEVERTTDEVEARYPGGALSITAIDGAHRAEAYDRKGVLMVTVKRATKTEAAKALREQMGKQRRQTASREDE